MNTPVQKSNIFPCPVCGKKLFHWYRVLTQGGIMNGLCCRTEDCLVGSALADTAEQALEMLKIGVERDRV